MIIAKTTQPHLLTREAAAARIEALEAALRDIIEGQVNCVRMARDALVNQQFKEQDK